MKYLFRNIAFVLVVLLSACGSPPSELIDLNDLEPLPASSGNTSAPLKVAIAAVISPQGTLESYAPLLDYLEAQLGRPVEGVQGSTYSETNEVLESGLADVAFVCTGAYIKGSTDFGMEILVVPEINGESVYHSWVIVPMNSPADDITDLRGKVFAYTDPLSLSGWMYPNYLLYQMGEPTETFFSRTFFTYSHDRSIRAVAEGFADGAAVDSLIYSRVIEREPSLGERLRIIHKSPAFGMPPVVVNPTINPVLRAELQKIFLSMSDNPDGKAALAVLGIDRFVLADDGLYASAREVDLKISTQSTISP